MIVTVPLPATIEPVTLVVLQPTPVHTEIGSALAVAWAKLRIPNTAKASIGFLRLEKLGISYVPSSANFVLTNFGERAIEIRDRLRDCGILVRDRSYEVPGHVRVTAGTREQTRRLLAALEEIW